ncbi:class I SAM-dependent methyltransferase [Paraburkholderia guartelaensis]|uniref:class I SAM-dependent methyltransferase n=1 Tax=Paraburkholderia guartelaensis TaxID=2546446 RepID=UPI003879A552
MGPADFGAFEHEGWERVAQAYHTYFGDLTAQSNRAMLETLGVGRGTRFLDVACGPGYLAAAARRRGADVAGVDFSVAMVDRRIGAMPGNFGFLCAVSWLPHSRLRCKIVCGRSERQPIIVHRGRGALPTLSILAACNCETVEWASVMPSH